jgi:nucleoside-diphosphate-sugar epimerase
MSRILIAGCGYVGAALARLLVDDGDEVFGLKRSPDGLPDGVEPVAADVTDPASLDHLPSGLHALVYAVSPSGGDEASYRAAYVDGFVHLLEAVRPGSPELGRTLLVSSTGAYGYADGRWVDEETPPRPNHPRGEVLVEAEERAVDGPPRGVVLRLGGIYGPGRTSTVRRVLAGSAGCPHPERYSNRIHRDDAAGAARHLLRLAEPEALYVGVDREPAPLRDVYRWIAERGGAPDPCADEEAEAWEATGRRGTNKRCRSDRLAASGYAFRYPTYREGYGPLVDEVTGGGAR